MGSPRIRRYWDLILTKSWFWIVFSCLIRIFTLKNSIKKLSGPATPLKWKTHFRCHFGANQKFCRMYFTLMFLGFHISIMFGSFSDLFFFSCWFHKCPQKSILTYIPEVMWYLLWRICSSTILAAKLDLLVVYRLFGSVCTIENEHTVFTPMIACL